MGRTQRNQTDAMLRIIAALDSPLRLRIIELLADEEHPVHELVAKLGQSQPLVSQHLRVLKMAGLINGHRTGRKVTYSLVDHEILEIIGSLKKLTDRISGE